MGLLGNYDPSQLYNSPFFPLAAGASQVGPALEDYTGATRVPTSGGVAFAKGTGAMLGGLLGGVGQQQQYKQQQAMTGLLGAKTQATEAETAMSQFQLKQLQDYIASQSQLGGGAPPPVNRGQGMNGAVGSSAQGGPGTPDQSGIVGTAPLKLVQKQYATTPSDYDPYFSAAEQKYNLPQGFLKQVAGTESNFNPNATGSKGEHGIMQFMPDTAKQYGANVNDPASEIDGAGRYFKDLFAKYNGDPVLATAAYNWGPKNVDMWVKGGYQTDQLPDVTKNEIFQVTGKSMTPPPAGRTLPPGPGQPGAPGVVPPMNDPQAFIDQGKLMLKSGVASLAGPGQALIEKGLALQSMPTYYGADGRVYAKPGAATAEGQLAFGKSQGEAEAKVGPAITQAGGEAAARSQFETVNVYDPKTGATQIVPKTAALQAGNAGNPLYTDNPRGTQQATEMNEYDTAARNAHNALQQINELNHALAGVNTGAHGAELLEFQKTLQRIGESIGADVSDLSKKNSAMEMANYVGMQIVATATKDISSRTAQSIFQNVKTVKPGIEMTPQGRAMVTAKMNADAQRAIDLSNFAHSYYQGDGNKVPDGAFKTDALNQFAQKNPDSFYAAMGNRLVGDEGGYQVPTAAARFLLEHPEMRGDFDKKYAPLGVTSAQILGK